MVKNVKILFILIDGIGDIGINEKQKKTPLQTANIPTFDALAKRVDRDFDKWGLELIDTINGLRVPGFPDHFIKVQHATEHRCGVILSGPGLTDKITGTDPLKDNLVLRKVVGTNQEGNYTAQIVNSLSDEIHRVLENHPLNKERAKKGLVKANIVLLRGAGMKLKVETFEDKHKIKPFMIAPTAIINGLGQTLGMKIVKAEGATGDYHSNFKSKFQTAFQFFQQNPQFNFGFLHVKAVDDCGHDKDLEGKIKYLEIIDQCLNDFLQNAQSNNLAQQEYIICLTGDHTTPVQVGDHSFEPVPVAISSSSSTINLLKKDNNSQKNLFNDQVQQYDEVSACKGVLGRFVGSQLIEILLKLRNHLLLQK
ncbi:hypothetical protein IMG5_194300 [Ichthyophthirius multifiliis]|uniref:Metalloenzyme domain-containing protein n=1 Tax=Ichthyophthirius multifiliis TaxID=5932 RepID=G0R4R1_ICHMU|nr:hypothetical protein IMG5_194300 [Ichthyophthirius multifiliis]EGR27567.1 hypothetical protein IMG5_194300 [Ichthyophthirius multifiliis]|eukprot:XP_004025019.1 hypothetical protein IMG5_194300 [Ichthyophthirius multifiliis]